MNLQNNPFASMNAVNMNVGPEFLRLEQDAEPTPEFISAEVEKILAQVEPYQEEVVPVTEPLEDRPEFVPIVPLWVRIWRVLNMDVRDVWKLIVNRWRKHGSR